MKEKGVGLAAGRFGVGGGVIHVLPWFGDAYGHVRATQSMVSGLHARGLDVRLALLTDGPRDRPLVRGVDQLCIRSSRRISLSAIRDLYLAIQEQPVALVHTHRRVGTLTGVAAARLARVPVVTTHHSERLNTFLRLSDHVITVSERVAERLEAIGFSPDRVSAALNGLGPTPSVHPTQEEARSALGLPQGVPILCSVARLERAKGIDTLLHAFARVRRRWPEAVLVVVGGGGKWAFYAQMAKALGVADGVRLVGYQDPVMPWLEASDIFVLASETEGGAPLALIEAMQAGLPVVATDVGGVSELVVPGSGKVVPPKIPTALALSIEEYLTCPEMAAEFARVGRVRALSQCSEDAVAFRVASVYERLLAEDAEFSVNSRFTLR